MLAGGIDAPGFYTSHPSLYKSAPSLTLPRSQKMLTVERTRISTVRKWVPSPVSIFRERGRVREGVLRNNLLKPATR